MSARSSPRPTVARRGPASLSSRGRLAGRRAAVGSALLLAGILAGRPVSAGPPFLTDDPQPVDLGHWEFYLASQWSLANHSGTGTAPHVEVNYGALPELQLHAIVPATLAWQSGQPV